MTLQQLRQRYPAMCFASTSQFALKHTWAKRLRPFCLVCGDTADAAPAIASLLPERKK